MAFYGGGSSYNFDDNDDDFKPAISPEQAHRKLRLFARVLLGISIFFWSWAVFNTLTMSAGFDLGTVSFLTTALSSGYLLSKQGERPTWKTRIAITASHSLVAANYALGTWFSFNAGRKVYVVFALYCSTFTCLWVGVVVFGWRLVSDVKALYEEEEEDEEDFDDEEEMDNLYDDYDDDGGRGFYDDGY